MTLTVIPLEEAAEYLRVTPEKLRRYRDDWGGFGIGNDVRFTKEGIDDRLRELTLCQLPPTSRKTEVYPTKYGCTSRELAKSILAPSARKKMLA